jgi:AcrR family transcriptional regulator
MMAVEPRVRAAATQARRAEILEAALRCFVDKGFASATIEEIRSAAGASVGSLYHHFSSKEDLAAALYVEGLADYQAGMVAVLDTHGDAEDGVKAAVMYHVSWVVEHADLARYLFSVREPDVIGSRAEELRKLNHGFFGAVRAWLARRVNAGAIRRLAPDLYYALWIGPAQELARNLVFGRVRTGWRTAATVLGDAAWRSLREERR